MLFDVIEATWPPFATENCDGVTLRDGQGGGKRVSAATAPDNTSEAILDLVIERMGVSMDPLFQIEDGQKRLDRLLADRGFDVIDPVSIYLANIQRVAEDGPPPVSAFSTWPPLAMQTEVWEAAGVNASRRAVMARVQGPKRALLARTGNAPSGAAFVAIHEDTAMVHALEISAEFRRNSAGRNLMRCAAQWAASEGATQIATLTLKDNVPANALFTSLGMRPVGQYHYRLKHRE